MFNYHMKLQAEEYSFIRIPRVLITEETFQLLSIQAKLLYGMLIDRMGSSYKNQWFDEENRVYIIYSIKDIQEDMRVSKHKAVDTLAELEKMGLVEKRVRGNGMATHLYVKKFVPALVRGAESALQ